MEQHNMLKLLQFIANKMLLKISRLRYIAVLLMELGTKIVYLTKFEQLLHFTPATENNDSIHF